MLASRQIDRDMDSKKHSDRQPEQETLLYDIRYSSMIARTYTGTLGTACTLYALPVVLSQDRRSLVGLAYLQLHYNKVENTDE